MVEWIESHKIRATHAGTSAAQIRDVARDIESGIEPAPIVLRALADGTFTIADGRHRFAAMQLSGWSCVPAEVRRG